MITTEGDLTIKNLQTTQGNEGKLGDITGKSVLQEPKIAIWDYQMTKDMKKD